jgi:hypothetical protein
MNNYFLKKQLLGEIQEAIRFKDLNIEGLLLGGFWPTVPKTMSDHLT